MEIDNRYEIQMKQMPVEDPMEREKYLQVTEELKSALREERFIQNKSLEFLLKKTYYRILGSNTLAYTPGPILLLRSPIVNASCYAEGTIILTTGLLSTLRTESELAFVIAHELAHYQLRHPMTMQGEWYDVLNYHNWILKRSLEGKIGVKQVEWITSEIYDGSRFNREAENLADELAVKLIANAGFNSKGALNALTNLDSLEKVNPVLGSRLFESLSTPKYQFDPIWLNERSSLYHKEQELILFFKSDSLVTHPDFSQRKDRLVQTYDTLLENDQKPIYMLSDSLRIVCQFESALGGYNDKQFDYSLYYCLLLKHFYPRNKYLNKIIASILIDTYEARWNGHIDEYVPKMTINYNQDLRLVNNLLHNLTDVELLDLAFYFLSYTRNFDSNDQSHYYLIYRICELSKRSEVAKMVINTYTEKYPNGEFVKRMK